MLVVIYYTLVYNGEAIKQIRQFYLCVETFPIVGKSNHTNGRANTLQLYVSTEIFVVCASRTKITYTLCSVSFQPNKAIIKGTVSFITTELA